MIAKELEVRIVLDSVPQQQDLESFIRGSFVPFLTESAAVLEAGRVRIHALERLAGAFPPQVADGVFKAIRHSFDGPAMVEFGVQLQALRLEEGWSHVLKQHGVRVGLLVSGADIVTSVDADYAMGKSEQYVADLTMLAKAGDLRPLSVLVSLDRPLSPWRLYEFVVERLGIPVFDVVVPAASQVSAAEYGRFMCDLFDVWVEKDDPDVDIRFFGDLFGKLSRPGSKESASVRISGTLSVECDLQGNLRLPYLTTERSIAGGFVLQDGVTKLLEAAGLPALVQLAGQPSGPCVSCCWWRICGGGHPWHRFEGNSRTPGSSHLCSGLQDIYAHTSAYLMNIGVPTDEIMRRLGIDETAEDH